MILLMICLKKQAILLKKFTMFELQLIEEGIEQFAKMAHLLSREYLDHHATPKVINQSISL
ncbi:hypothetical protein ACFYKT_18240 [Cytobacillus sp. FJAT-53684]|uniref:Uncharacterized protein n=1 Tax=Cytobacillus mangrovibacter TaxID=3299024 RepID=A0ABW6K2A5_9BACI